MALLHHPYYNKPQRNIQCSKTNITKIKSVVFDNFLDSKVSKNIVLISVDK
jgi:hypothetical protein